MFGEHLCHEVLSDIDVPFYVANSGVFMPMYV
jgi:hypothetical protein